MVDRAVVCGPVACHREFCGSGKALSAEEVMSDVFAVAKLLMGNAIKTCGHEIDIIAYSGSYARGEARDDSDLDIFYIPVDGKTHR